MAEDSLVKSYKKIETDTPMEQDAIEAFSQIIPFIQSRYPKIQFDPIKPEMIYLDYDGNYSVYGSYEGRLLGFIPYDKFVIVRWGRSDYPQDRYHEDYTPSVQLGVTYEFGSFGQLEEVLNENIRLPKKKA